jgi:cytochrome c-type biogenesis protein CcmE
VRASHTRQPLRVRWRFLVVAIVVVAGTGVLAMSGLNGTTVYYLTPTEIITSRPAPEKQIRLGGLVKTGTVHSNGDRVGFVLTDGSTDVSVTSVSALPRIFQEGEGAVVEGTLGNDGVFRAQQIMVRHSNEYRPPATASRPQP